MITLTEEAKELFLNVEHPGGTVLRLDPVVNQETSETQIGLSAGEPMNDDQVVEHNGETLLHIAAEGEYQASERLRQAADRLESPTALQLRLFQTMGEIAVNQNSTIILPIPIDLLRPYLNATHNGHGASAQQKSEEQRRREEREAERRYKEALGDASREVSSEEVPTEMPDGEANP